MKKGLFILSVSLLLSTRASVNTVEEIAQNTANACEAILKAKLLERGCSCGNGKSVDAEDVKCPCGKPRADVEDVKCPCGKPRADVEDTKCPCGKPTRDADDVKCPCGKPRADVEDVKCPCGKPRADVEDVKCPCGKPRSAQIDNEAILTQVQYALLNQKKNNITK